MSLHQIQQLREVKQNWNSEFLFHSAEYIEAFQDGSLTLSQSFGDSSILLQFRVVDHTVYSPVSASFGGPVFCPGKVNDSDLNQFVEGVEEELRKKGIQSIIIRTPPGIYSERYLDTVSRVFKSNNYKQVFIDVNQHLDIGLKYEDLIRYNELKKLRQAESSMTFRKLEIESLREVYEVIHRNRNWKGYPMTMTLEEMGRMFELFPQNYLLFGVFDSDELVAAAVSIRINESILYNFYHGDVEETRSKSPVVMLVKGIYNYALAHEYTILDLGISSVESKINKGLYRFKKNLGAVETERITWKKDL